jgi:hypothetical protein
MNWILWITCPMPPSRRQTPSNSLHFVDEQERYNYVDSGQIAHPTEWTHENSLVNEKLLPNTATWRHSLSPINFVNKRNNCNECSLNHSFKNPSPSYKLFPPGVPIILPLALPSVLKFNPKPLPCGVCNIPSRLRSALIFD